MSFDTNGHTMMGVAPAALAGWIEHASIDVVAFGANCGIGPADAVVAVAGMKTATPDAVIVAKANCGIPQVIDGAMWYPASAEDMSAYASLALDAGARIIGACCGSMPEHIAQIRKVVDSHTPADGVRLEDVDSQLGELSRPISRGDGRRGKASRSSRRRSSSERTSRSAP
jgi:5-methyltetrahydrofolate--homocysteine methyltransferase